MQPESISGHLSKAQLATTANLQGNAAAGARQAAGHPAANVSSSKLPDRLDFVLKPIAEGDPANHPAVKDSPEAAKTLEGLLQVLRPIEGGLFERLHLDPTLAQQFVLDPMQTLKEMKLLGPGAEARITELAKQLAPRLARK